MKPLHIHKSNYNCHFCLQPCYRQSFSTVEIWKCAPCYTSYKFVNPLSISPSSVEMTAQIKDDVFILTLEEHSATIHKIIDYVDIEGHFLTPALVEKLDVKPTNVTPKNVADKIKMYLMFL